MEPSSSFRIATQGIDRGDFVSLPREPFARVLHWVDFLVKAKGILIIGCCLLISMPSGLHAANRPASGTASWYGEAHRGKLMANGQKFDPDDMTAASWFYPLGTKVKVTLKSPALESRCVTVTITDRGPAWRLVRRHRIIDLTQAAFKRLAHPDLGLVKVTVEKIEEAPPLLVANN